MNYDRRISGLLTSTLFLILSVIGSTNTDAATAAAVAAQAASHGPQQPLSENATTVVGENQSTGTSADTDDAATALPASKPIPDPFQRYNQVAFSFNDKFDIYFMKPVAEFYNIIMPKPLNEGIHNVFNNLDEIPAIVNDVLQLHFYQFANDAWRFTINSTVGIGGLFDVATRIGLPRYQNDFGLTLAQYGYQNSAYWVWPFLGSYTIRDGFIGLPVDYYGFSVYPYIKPKGVRLGVLGLYFVDYRANLLQYQPLFEEAAIDKYIFVRNAYMRNRNYKIEQNAKRGVRDLFTGKPPHRLHMSSMPTG